MVIFEKIDWDTFSLRTSHIYVQLIKSCLPVIYKPSLAGGLKSILPYIVFISTSSLVSSHPIDRYIQSNPAKQPPQVSDHLRNATSFVQSRVKHLCHVQYYFPKMQPPRNSEMRPQYPGLTGEKSNSDHMLK